MSTQIDLAACLGTYRQITLLYAESAGLTWDAGSNRIKAISIELEQLERDLPKPATQVAVCGFYHGGEELCGLWAIGSPDPWSFASQALDFFATELDPATSFMGPHNLRHAAHMFGPAVVETLFELIEAAMSELRTEHCRYETTRIDDEQDIEVAAYAAIAADNVDTTFEEAAIVTCEPGDAGATLLTRTDLDIDAFAGLFELVSERDSAARRALRGESLDAGPAS